MKRLTLQNRRIGVLRMAFRGFREKGPCSQILPLGRVFRRMVSPGWLSIVLIRFLPILCRCLKVSLHAYHHPNLYQTVANEVLRLRGHYVTPIQS